MSRIIKLEVYIGDEALTEIRRDLGRPPVLEDLKAWIRSAVAGSEMDLGERVDARARREEGSAFKR